MNSQNTCRSLPSVYTSLQVHAQAQARISIENLVLQLLAVGRTLHDVLKHEGVSSVRWRFRVKCI
jgi:hypothetical protein